MKRRSEVCFIRQRYLLDTDIYSLSLEGASLVAQRMARVPEDCLWISVVTVQEVLRGWINRVDQEPSKAGDRIGYAYGRLVNAIHELERSNFLHYTPQAHQVFTSMSASAKLVGTNDRRIAASAIAHDMIVVTRNMRHFEKIVGVRCEDWSIFPEAG